MNHRDPALATFNAARASYGLPPVSAIPGSKAEADAAVVAEAEAVVAASVGWDE